MAAVFPGGIKTWTDKANDVDWVDASHVNEAYAEIIAIENNAIRYAADAGSTDSYVVNIPGATLTAGLAIRLKVNTANTGAASLSIDNGTTTKTIKKNVSDDLETGDLLSGQFAFLIYDGTNWQLQSSSELKAHKADNASGWIPITDTWTYASATSFMVSGDKTGAYQKGDKFKVTISGSTIYGYIINVSYSAPNTTVTVAGNALINAAFSNKYISKADNPQGFPHYFPWTPTLTWTTATPAAQYSKYVFAIKGHTCFVKFWFQTANGAGATNLSISLPVTAFNMGGYSMPLPSFTVINSTFANPQAYLSDSLSAIGFGAFPAFTNGQACQIVVSGNYQI
jgi:hypothetical protein